MESFSVELKEGYKKRCLQNIGGTYKKKTHQNATLGNRV